MDLKNMKFKNYIITMLKGILLGLISMGIPGVSASTIGIIIGIYFLMVDSIANIFKDFKTNFKFLISLIIGYGIGAILAAFSVTIIFEHFPLLTTIIILGMIIGSIPDMLIRLKGNFKKVSCWITFITVITIIIAYNFLTGTKDAIEFPLNPDIGYLILMSLVGIITSATFIIPGVDFAVVFLSLGLYYPFMNMIAALLSFNNPDYFTYFISYIQILGFYLIGYFGGVFLFSKLIKFLTIKYNSQTKFASLGLMFAAPVIVIKGCIIDNKAFFYNTPQLVIGIILSIFFAIGICYLGYRSRITKIDHDKLIEEEK